MKQIKQILNYVRIHGIFIWMPLFIYLPISLLLKTIDNSIYTIIASVFYFLFLIYCVFYFFMYLTEVLEKFINSGITKLRFIWHIILIIIFTSLCFTSFYWCIYNFDNSNFSNLNETNWFYQYLDFFYYSIGIFLVNNESGIIPMSFYAKLFVITEKLTTYTLLIIFLSNYRILRNPFNEHLERKNKSE